MNRITAVMKDEGIKATIFKIMCKITGFQWQNSLIVGRDLKKPFSEEMLNFKPAIEATFRIATIDDYDMFKEMKIHNDDGLKRIHNRLQSDDYNCLIGVYKEKIVVYRWVCFIDSYVTIAKLNVKLGEKEVYNLDGYVTPEYRGMKLGFVATCIHLNYIKEKGYNRVVSVIQENNPPPRKIVYTFGYEIIKKATLVELFGLHFNIYSKPKAPLWPYSN